MPRTRRRRERVPISQPVRHMLEASQNRNVLARELHDRRKLPNGIIDRTRIAHGCLIEHIFVIDRNLHRHQRPRTAKPNAAAAAGGCRTG